MALNFPLNPATDDNFSINGNAYTFDGTKWVSNASIAVNAAGVIYSNTISGLTATTVQSAIDEQSALVSQVANNVTTVESEIDEQSALISQVANNATTDKKSIAFSIALG